MSDLFSTFSEKDILKDGSFRGKAMPAETIAALREQAKNLKKSLLWKILKAELEWFAIKSIAESGKDADDLRYMRLFGNLIQVVDKKLDNIA